MFVPYRVQVNWRELQAGQLIEIDPELWQPEIAAGWLLPETPGPEYVPPAPGSPSALRAALGFDA